MDFSVKKLLQRPSKQVKTIMNAIQSDFDEEFYLAQNPDVEDKSALQHYVELGWKNGFDPCDWFSVTDYLAVNSDVEKEQTEPFYHYLTLGKQENRSISASTKRPIANENVVPTDLITPTVVPNMNSHLSSDEQYIASIIEHDFDCDFYDNNYKFEGNSALEHFIRKGWKLGNDPCAWFCSDSYLELNPDVKSSKVNPFFHYLVNGKSENRPYKPSNIKTKKDIAKSLRKLLVKELDEDFYREKYAISADECAIEHFLSSAPSDLLDPNPWFSSESYLELNPDVKGIEYPAFCHFLLYGVKEKREFFTGMDTSKEKPTPVSPRESLERFEQSELGKIAQQLRNQNGPTMSKNWLNWTRKLKTVNAPPAFVKSHLELAVNFSNGDDGILLGWLIKEGNPVIWAEDESNNLWFYDTNELLFDITRRDVFDAFNKSEFELYSDQLGFALRLPCCAPSGSITLKCLSRLGVHILGSKDIEQIGFNPVNVAKWMFGIATPTQYLAKRFAELDIPIVDNIIKSQRELQKHLEHKVMQYGSEVQEPQISIIIPLYGRIDFIENQMLCFEKDEFIKNKCQLIYVIDDPNIEAELAEKAEFIHRLYGIPFKTVYGSANRGFSGANNLGAEYSTGSHLLFLNSDVFPNHTGWLEEMLSTLQSNPEIGVIAPRLLFADGSLQHAGIEFKYRTDLGIWINHHPQMGLAPELDSNQELTYLPAVTGACMLISRGDFDAIDGWDTGYLIGDFEDSDLCLKLRSKGKHCAYLPTVNLTHLERQSFSLTGSDDFRTKVVIYNATRHQTRWAKLLAESV